MTVNTQEAPVSSVAPTPGAVATDTVSKLQGYHCVNCRGNLRSEKILCAACRGVYYCGKNCQVAHWRANHKIACQLYKHILAKDATSDLPFTYPLRVKPGKIDSWIKERGITPTGLWRRESTEWSKYAYGQLDRTEDLKELWGNLDTSLLPQPLASGKATTGDEDPAQFPKEVLTNWADYYSLRSLPLSSPVGVLLSLPLTLYSLITGVLADHKRVKGKKQLEIFILGAEKELDQLITLTELAHLIPETKFRFSLVGPSIPTDFSYTSPHPRCTFNFYRGEYHDCASRLPAQPDIAIAPNAQLEAYPSWRPTIQKLTTQKVPSFFSDACETSTLNATRLFATVGAREGFQVRLNPFRVPLWKEVDVHAMPSYGNGYLQGINI